MVRNIILKCEFVTNIDKKWKILEIRRIESLCER